MPRPSKTGPHAHAGRPTTPTTPRPPANQALPYVQARLLMDALVEYNKAGADIDILAVGPHMVSLLADDMWTFILKDGTQVHRSIDEELPNHQLPGAVNALSLKDRGLIQGVSYTTISRRAAR